MIKKKLLWKIAMIIKCIEQLGTWLKMCLWQHSINIVIPHNNITVPDPQHVDQETAAQKEKGSCCRDGLFVQCSFLLDTLLWLSQIILRSIWINLPNSHKSSYLAVWRGTHPAAEKTVIHTHTHTSMDSHTQINTHTTHGLLHWFLHRC